MLTLKTVSFKNFRSYGNQLTTIDLTRNKSTVITGANGNGKTTIEQAIEFGLFGEVVGINKGDLVNDINKKDCYVKVEFEESGRTVVVERGIKPAILSISVDGKLLDEEAGVVKQQKDFEETILGFNLATFKQVVSISGGNFTPFMRLPAGKRREFVEELLGLTIFSKMQKEHLATINATRDRIRDVDSEIKTLSAAIDAYKEGIRNAEENSNDQKDLARTAIEAIEAEISDLRKKIESHHSEIEKLCFDSARAANEKRTAKLGQMATISGEISAKLKDAGTKQAFFTNHDACPTCSQPIGADFKAGVISELTQTIGELQEGRKRLTAAIEETRAKNSEFLELKERVDRINYIIRLAQQEIESKAQSIKHYRKIMDQSGGESAAEAMRAKMHEKIDAATAAQREMNELLVEVQYNTLIQAMIKDTGIKSVLVKQYIPLMNQKINEYMELLGMPITVKLDETFEIEILSLYCKDRPYSTFSAGERTRIDIAILFAWRDVAKTINSLNCNVLFIDEAFDKELDADGIECFTEFLNSMGDTNVFMISHRTEIIERMRSTIKINKVGNFSRIDE